MRRPQGSPDLAYNFPQRRRRTPLNLRPLRGGEEKALGGPLGAAPLRLGAGAGEWEDSAQERARGVAGADRVWHMEEASEAAAMLQELWSWGVGGSRVCLSLS